MRFVAALVLLASTAYAKPGFSFKLVSEFPALHKGNEIRAHLEPQREAVIACGVPVKRGVVPLVKLHVGDDGAIVEVEIDQQVLSDETAACVRKVLGAITLPARKKPSVVKFALVYPR